MPLQQRGNRPGPRNADAHRLHEPARSPTSAGGDHLLRAARDRRRAVLGRRRENGQLGDGQPNSTGANAVDVAGIDWAVAVSAGATVAVLSSGEVRCWGVRRLRRTARRRVLRRFQRHARDRRRHHIGQRLSTQVRVTPA